MYTLIYEEGRMMQLAIGIQREKWYVFTPYCIYIYVYIERETYIQWHITHQKDVTQKNVGSKTISLGSTAIGLYKARENRAIVRNSKRDM